MDEYVKYLKNEVLPELERNVEHLNECGRAFGKNAFYLKRQRYLYTLIEAVHKQIPSEATYRGGCPRCHRTCHSSI